MQITVLAWLPGTNKMAVQNDQSQIGWVEAYGNAPQFYEQFPQFVEAAVTKYGYVRLPYPKVIDLKDAKAFAQSLNNGIM